MTIGIVYLAKHKAALANSQEDYDLSFAPIPENEVTLQANADVSRASSRLNQLVFKPSNTFKMPPISHPPTGLEKYQECFGLSEMKKLDADITSNHVYFSKVHLISMLLFAVLRGDLKGKPVAGMQKQFASLAMQLPNEIRNSYKALTELDQIDHHIIQHSPADYAAEKIELALIARIGRVCYKMGQLAKAAKQNPDPAWQKVADVAENILENFKLRGLPIAQS